MENACNAGKRRIQNCTEIQLNWSSSYCVPVPRLGKYFTCIIFSSTIVTAKQSHLQRKKLRQRIVNLLHSQWLSFGLSYTNVHIFLFVYFFTKPCSSQNIAGFNSCIKIESKKKCEYVNSYLWEDALYVIISLFLLSCVFQIFCNILVISLKTKPHGNIRCL